MSFEERVKKAQEALTPPVKRDNNHYHSAWVDWGASGNLEAAICDLEHNPHADKVVMATLRRVQDQLRRAEMALAGD